MSPRPPHPRMPTTSASCSDSRTLTSAARTRRASGSAAGRSKASISTSNRADFRTDGSGWILKFADQLGDGRHVSDAFTPNGAERHRLCGPARGGSEHRAGSPFATGTDRLRSQPRRTPTCSREPSHRRVRRSSTPRRNQSASHSAKWSLASLSVVTVASRAERASKQPFVYSMRSSTEYLVAWAIAGRIGRT